MCELYQVAKSSVSEHIAHIFEDGELEQQATVREFRTVQEVAGTAALRILSNRSIPSLQAVIQKNNILSYRPEFLYFGLIFLQQEDRSHGHPKHKPSASLP